MERHLFLFGDTSALTDEFAGWFVALAGGEEAEIALLYDDEENRDFSDADFVQLLKKKGAGLFQLFSIQEELDQTIKEKLQNCTGIIVTGKDANKFQQQLVETDYGKVIQNLYKIGKPVAGFAAGALVAPEHCILSPKETPSGSQIYRRGLGLLSDKVIGVPVETWEEEFSLKIAMKKTDSPYGYGLNHMAGLYFVNEVLIEKNGQGEVHFYKQKKSNQ